MSESRPPNSGWDDLEQRCADHGGIGYCSPLCPGDEINRLLEASSLGTPEAKRLLASVEPALVTEALRRARLCELTQESQDSEGGYS
jgi:hypothetical protein